MCCTIWYLEAGMSDQLSNPWDLRQTQSMRSKFGDEGQGWVLNLLCCTAILTVMQMILRVEEIESTPNTEQATSAAQLECLAEREFGRGAAPLEAAAAAEVAQHTFLAVHLRCPNQQK
jgi:hypothetical protein